MGWKNMKLKTVLPAKIEFVKLVRFAHQINLSPASALKLRTQYVKIVAPAPRGPSREKHAAASVILSVKAVLPAKLQSSWSVNVRQKRMPYALNALVAPWTNSFLKIVLQTRTPSAPSVGGPVLLINTWNQVVQ